MIRADEFFQAMPTEQRELQLRRRLEEVTQVPEAGFALSILDQKGPEEQDKHKQEEQEARRAERIKRAIEYLRIVT